MTTGAGGGAGERKTGRLVSEDWRFFVFIGLMLFFLAYLFLVIYIGWLFIPFGIYFFMKAWRTRKGEESLYCSECGAAAKDKNAKKCSGCGVDLAGR